MAKVDALMFGCVFGALLVPSFSYPQGSSCTPVECLEIAIRKVQTAEDRLEATRQSLIEQADSNQRSMLAQIESNRRAVENTVENNRVNAEATLSQVRQALQPLVVTVPWSQAQAHGVQACRSDGSGNVIITIECLAAAHRYCAFIGKASGYPQEWSPDAIMFACHGY